MACFIFNRRFWTVLQITYIYHYHHSCDNEHVIDEPCGRYLTFPVTMSTLSMNHVTATFALSSPWATQVKASSAAWEDTVAGRGVEIPVVKISCYSGPITNDIEKHIWVLNMSIEWRYEWKKESIWRCNCILLQSHRNWGINPLLPSRFCKLCVKSLISPTLRW